MSSAGVQARADPRLTRAGGAFKRTYKACETCRKTKAKCERNESSQSCLKCQREQRDCVFPAYRSTKRAKIDRTVLSPSSTVARPESIAIGEVRVSHKAYASDQQFLPDTSRRQISTRSPSTALLESVGDSARVGGTVSHDQSQGHSINNVPRASGSQTTFQPEQPLNDAENVQIPSLANHLHDQVVQTVVASSKDAVGLLFGAANTSDPEGSDDVETQDINDDTPEQSITNSLPSQSLNTREHISPHILELWNQHRFVKQGWFTAREAAAYVHAFFKHLSPLSPVMESYPTDPANQRRLILEEPLLCCTVLMISSRHYHPPGHGGSIRADFIHGRVWKHIEHLVQRITFGSEKYSIAKSRTLGSIQALLLITDWHPRSLHFPPDNDGWDSSLAATVDDSFTPQERDTEASRRWREDVFEPAKRSDRLSWMLVGVAITLAHELGVFKVVDEADSGAPTTTHPSKLQIRRLLYLYATQLSLRLGCTSIYPLEALEHTDQPSKHVDFAMEQAYHERESMLSKWIEITKLLATVAEMFFASRSTTLQMLRSTRYISLLNHFRPLLDSWYDSYIQLSFPSIQDSARKILLVDYYYARIYIHSIAIQALVDRISNLAGGDQLWQNHEIWQSKHAQDFASVNEVRESSAKILMIAVELSEQGVLQYCPVRLYVRIVSASVFLLKTISLGSREADISASLNALDRCITALQTGRADDIHLSSRYAILISRHVQHFRRNFRARKNTLIHSTVTATPRRSRVSSPFTSNGTKSNFNQEEQQVNPTPYGGEGFHHSLGFLPEEGTTAVEQVDFGMDEMPEDWLAQPFNPQIAPFGLDYLPEGAGIAADSLDFLWNLSLEGQ